MLGAALRAEADELRARMHVAAFAPQRAGRVVACDGLLMQVEGLQAPLGALVVIKPRDGAADAPAEVIGFRDDRLLLMALERAAISPGDRAMLYGQADQVGTGAAVFGRVCDAMGAPIDSLGPVRVDGSWPLGGRALPTLARGPVDTSIGSGVRAIDALLTLGRGQRVGLIAGSGVGKSVLLQQMVRGTQADCVVLALIGERGREIGSFLSQLSDRARKRSHVVAVAADAAAPLRVRGVMRAFAIAEWLRADGHHVLLVVDSLTRVAHAQREIGLAAGEPPGRRGYPPSALDIIPKLVERAGNDRVGGGAITAILTVLADGDDLVSDPVVDTARGVLDGHILLDRGIAARGRFPAIDIGLSLSRTMADCASAPHLRAADRFRKLYALAEGNRELIAMGAYARGQDAEIDAAFDGLAAQEAFLAQPPTEAAAFDASIEALVGGWGQA